MSLCILAGSRIMVLAASFFTLSWTHSVEKVEWQEEWQVSEAGLSLIKARVKGSGAGMEPPPEAGFEQGWWIWQPRIDPVAELRLAASTAIPEGWKLCAGGQCLNLGTDGNGTIMLKPCGR